MTHPRVIKEEKVKNCEDWLAERLGQMKLVNIETIRAEAKDLGYTKSQLKDAKLKIGAATVNDSALHEGEPRNWFWCVPKED